MKKLLLLAILIAQFCLANCHSSACAISALTFYPLKKEISVNSKFIIEGYAFSQKTIENLSDYKVYLEDNQKNKIMLEIVEILKGEMKLTQAILKPNQQLTPNTTYFLRIIGISDLDKNSLYKWNSDTEKREPISWITNNTILEDLISENLQLKYHQDKATLFGCGPEIYAIFNIKNSKNRETWYKTEVVSLKSNSKTTYILVTKEDKLNVGHGMCAGAFTFKDKGKYKIRFTPMNIETKMNKPTNWITIENPNNQNAFGF